MPEPDDAIISGLTHIDRYAIELHSIHEYQAGKNPDRDGSLPAGATPIFFSACIGLNPLQVMCLSIQARLLIFFNAERSKMLGFFVRTCWRQTSRFSPLASSRSPLTHFPLSSRLTGGKSGGGGQEAKGLS